MIYSAEVQNMCSVAKGAYHGPAPIPEEGKWVQAKEIKDISGFTHGIGWCAPQQGACKLTLNVKEGVIEEALVETIGCSGMTHSAAMAAEILIGKTILEVMGLAQPAEMTGESLLTKIHSFCFQSIRFAYQAFNFICQRHITCFEQGTNQVGNLILLFIRNRYRKIVDFVVVNVIVATGQFEIPINQ